MKKGGGISSFTLRISAMVLMLGDHLWATVIPGHDWLTWAGRLAFPIFAFLTAEGYHHTGNYRKYLRRMLLWALITELPYNLMYVGAWIWPFQQNVLWTFAIALVCMDRLDRVRQKHTGLAAALRCGLIVFAGFLAGKITFVDYSGEGVLMVLLFWFLRGDRWTVRLGQLAGMYWINWEMMRGLTVPVALLGQMLEIPRQGMAVAALGLIWLCRGRQGYHSRWFQYFCYGFYPAHMLILGLAARLI